MYLHITAKVKIMLSSFPQFLLQWPAVLYSSDHKKQKSSAKKSRGWAWGWIVWNMRTPLTANRSDSFRFSCTLQATSDTHLPPNRQGLFSKWKSRLEFSSFYIFLLSALYFICSGHFLLEGTLCKPSSGWPIRFASGTRSSIPEKNVRVAGQREHPSPDLARPRRSSDGMKGLESGDRPVFCRLS